MVETLFCAVVLRLRQLRSGADCKGITGGRKTEPKLSLNQACRETCKDGLGLSCAKTQICQLVVPYPKLCLSFVILELKCSFD